MRKLVLAFAGGILAWSAAAVEAPKFVAAKASFWLDAHDAGAVGQEVSVWHDHRGTGYPSAKSYREVQPKVVAVKAGPLAGKPAVDLFAFGTRCDMDFTRQRVEAAFFVMEMDCPAEDANFYLGDTNQCVLHGGYKNGCFLFEAAHGMVGRCTIAMDGKPIDRPFTTKMPEQGYHLYAWTSGSNTEDIHVGRLTQDRNLEQSHGHKRSGGKRLCELVMFNRMLTCTERAQLEKYLTEKWFGKQKQEEKK